MNLDGRLASLERRSGSNGSHEYVDQALAVISQFWRSYDHQIDPNGQPILVDLLHCNTEYVWRNLVVAKFVQHITGAPLVGLLGEPGIVAPVLGSLLSRSENARLASAFGVNHFVEIPNEDPQASEEIAVLKTIAELAMSQPDGTPLPPPAIAKLRDIQTLSGFPIGRSVQDTFMRGELEPTVLAGVRLVHWARRVLGFFGFAERLIATMRPLVFVTGHMDYCPWGTLAELLVRRGGRVVWYRMECRLPIHILHQIDAAKTLNGMIRRIERDAFFEFERQIDSNVYLAGRIDALARARSAAVGNGVGRHCRWLRSTRSSALPPLQSRSQTANYRPTVSLPIRLPTSRQPMKRCSSTTWNGPKRHASTPRRPAPTTSSSRFIRLTVHTIARAPPIASLRHLLAFQTYISRVIRSSRSTWSDIAPLV
jgi:hypothetical protein